MNSLQLNIVRLVSKVYRTGSMVKAAAVNSKVGWKRSCLDDHIYHVMGTESFDTLLIRSKYSALYKIHVGTATHYPPSQRCIMTAQPNLATEGIRFVVLTCAQKTKLRTLLPGLVLDNQPDLCLIQPFGVTLQEPPTGQLCMSCNQEKMTVPSHKSLRMCIINITTPSALF